jgi:hypothetical protein
VVVLTRAQQKTLRLLAVEGATVPALLRRGCTVGELQRLVHNGLASAERIQGKGVRPSPADYYLRISDPGRKALARQTRSTISMKVILLVHARRTRRRVGRGIRISHA